MPCSICKLAGHNYKHCNHSIINDSSIQLFNHMIDAIERPLTFYITYEHTIYPTSTHYFNIKKYTNRVTVGWNMSLWRRVFPRVIELLQAFGHTQYIDEFRRLSTDNHILQPGCSSHYKMHIAGLSQYIARKLVDNEYIRFNQNLQPINMVSFQLDDVHTQYFHHGKCPVCIERIDDTNSFAFSCLHAFCSRCVGELFQRFHNKCPSCREDITRVRFKSNILPEHFNLLSQILSS